MKKKNLGKVISLYGKMNKLPSKKDEKMRAIEFSI